MKAQARAYRRRYGHYPKLICADQIYRTHAIRAFCLRHAIRLSGTLLGRPKSDQELLAEDKHQFPDDQGQRNAVAAEGLCEAVGKIGQSKRRFGLVLIRDKLAVSQGSTIALNVMVMNLQKLLELLFIIFCGLAPAFTGRQRPAEYSHYAAERSDGCSIAIRAA